MLKEPNPQEQARAKARGEIAPALVSVLTHHAERLRKPDEHPEAFEEAAGKAIAEASEAGYDLIQFSGVNEFIIRGCAEGHAVAFRYVWEFTALKPEG